MPSKPSNKKRMEQARLVREQKKKTNQIIAIILGVIVVAVIGAFLYINYGPKAAAPTPAAVPTSANAGDTSVQPTIPADSTPSGQPPMTIDKTKQYFATVKMAKGGQFTIQLFPDKAPITVNSFIYLARKGFFNGITFHRVLDGFMAQGGDPTGTGGGGPGYQFVNEDSDLKFDKAGVVAMANAGRDTNGSQFFITFGPQPSLDGSYTIFGQVTEGMDVVNAITRRDPQTGPTFTGDAMESVTITEK